MKAGAQKFIIKDNEILLKNYVDAIKHATSPSNLAVKLRPLFTRNFQFHFKGPYGLVSGKKTEFPRFIFSRQNFYENAVPQFYMKNDKIGVIKFKLPNRSSLKQELHLEDFKITEIVESLPTMRGGQGYSIGVGQAPIAGQPVIKPYFDCCPPIYLGSLMKGGKANSGYYLDVANNHLVVQPQYRAYYNRPQPFTQN